MQKLSTYIEYLLMTRHYCYVPGRGAYMMSEEPASQGILPSLGGTNGIHEMVPPKRIVHFSSLLHHDDGVLANLLMEAEGMSYDEAYRFIKRQVCTLPDDFSQKSSLSTDVDNFGFETLKLETWGDIERRLQAANQPQRPESESEKEPRLEIRRDSVSIPTYWIKRAAIALLIAVFFFTDFIGLNKNNDQLASVLSVSILQRQVMVSQNLIDDVDGFDDLFDLDEEIAIDEIAEEELADELSPAERLIGKDAFYVVVGSTYSEKDAHRIYKRYANDDYPAAGIMIRGGLYRVYVNVLEDKTEATNYLRAIRKVNERLSKAWLFPVSGEESLSYSIKNIYNDNQLSMELSHPKQRTERDQG